MQKFTKLVADRNFKAIAKALNPLPIEGWCSRAWAVTARKFLSIPALLRGGGEAPDQLQAELDFDSITELFCTNTWQTIIESRPKITIFGYDESELTKHAPDSWRDDAFWSPLLYSAGEWWRLYECRLAGEGGPILFRLVFDDQGYWVEYWFMASAE